MRSKKKNVVKEVAQSTRIQKVKRRRKKKRQRLQRSQSLQETNGPLFRDGEWERSLNLPFPRLGYPVPGTGVLGDLESETGEETELLTGSDRVKVEIIIKILDTETLQGKGRGSSTEQAVSIRGIIEQRKTHTRGCTTNNLIPFGIGTQLTVSNGPEEECRGEAPLWCRGRSGDRCRHPRMESNQSCGRKCVGSLPQGVLSGLWNRRMVCVGGARSEDPFSRRGVDRDRRLDRLRVRKIDRRGGNRCVGWERSAFVPRRSVPPQRKTPIMYMPLW